MSKTNTITAVAVMNSPELVVIGPEAVAKLQAAALAQIALMRNLRREEALRGLLVGMTLLRIKASLPYGKFTPWVESKVKDVGPRYVNYLMSLALVFVEKARVAKPELLALPGDQTELALDSAKGASKHFLEKATKFCGDLSISELLEKHGVKKTKKIGGSRTSSTDETPAEPLTGAALATQAKEELSRWVWLGRQLLLQENMPSRGLTAEEIRSFDDSLTALTSEYRKGLSDLLKHAPKTAQE